MSSAWIESLSRRAVLDVAPVLGLTLEAKNTIGPCPACQATKRSESDRTDRRGPIGVNSNRLGWKCWRCDAQGDAVTLAAHVYLGEVPTKGDPRWRELHDRCLDAGLVTDDPSAAPPPRQEQAPPPKRPPLHEVEALWRASRPVDDDVAGDPGAGPLLSARKYTPLEAVAALDVVRVTPLEHDWPAWWPYEHPARRHTRGVWRLLTRAYEPDGTVASVHARAVLNRDQMAERDLAEQKPDGSWRIQKTRWPFGTEATGLLMADGRGLALLRGEAGDDVKVIVGEGLTSLLNASLRMAELRRDVAVITAASGGFKALAKVRWPARVELWIATDDCDEKKTGDRYAAEVLAAVPEHVRVRRIRWNEDGDGGRDMGDASAQEFARRLDIAAFLRGEDLPPPAVDELRKLVDKLQAAQDRFEMANLLAAFIEGPYIAELGGALVDHGPAIAGSLTRMRGIKGLSTDTTKLEKAIREAAQRAGAEEHRQQRQRERDPNRSDIEIRPDMVAVTREALDAIYGFARDRVYVRAGSLVDIVRDHGPKARAPEIRQIPREHLRLLLAEAADWYVVKRKGDDLVREDDLPPTWVVDSVATLPRWRDLRALDGLVEIPVLRPDGEIVEGPGYDEATRLLIEPPEGLRVHVPAEPRLEEAEAALDVLHDLLADFPWEATHHRSAALAAILTACARDAIEGPCPLFLFTASTAGSGKGLLADVVNIIATGRDLARMAFTDKEDELEKRITSIAVAGTRVVLFDNVPDNVALGGACLDAALTGTTWTGRELGSTRMVTCPWSTLLFATGNNVRLKGDMHRRVIPVRMTPEVERPEERTDFRHPKLRQFARQSRGQLLGAALTILRAYIVAGRPSMRLTPLGSFDEWSDLVREALVWVGELDPCLAMVQMRNEGDTVVAQMSALFGAWRADHGDADVFISDLAKTDATYSPTLHGVLLELARGKDGKVDTNRLGQLCKKFRGRVLSGLRLVQGSTIRHGTRSWAVTQAVTA